MLQIRKVVLFKHGVGFFEREGEVDSDVAVDLHFKASEMNDVLKSLTVLDLADGHIASISYESTHSHAIDAKTRAALEEILALNDLARDLSSVLVQQERELKRIQENQKRVRQNLQALGDSKDERSLRERYVLELGQEEDALKDLSSATTQAQRERERLLADLQKKVRELSFESS